MPKYRKKPVVIEATQWTGKNTEEIKEFGAPFHMERHLIPLFILRPLRVSCVLNDMTTSSRELRGNFTQ
jgi:hypothetical protein